MADQCDDCGSQRLTIPFGHAGRDGRVDVICEAIESPVTAGFDLLQVAGLDPSRCHGYPSLRAEIDYAGTGYRTLMAWIQLVKSTRYDGLADQEPASIDIDLDVAPSLLERGVPFFAYGYPACLYDAPCDNLGTSARLHWLAETYLVTFPSRMNGDTIAFLAGFSWGYCEWDEAGARRVALLTPRALAQEAWLARLPVLRKQCPDWAYV